MRLRGGGGNPKDLRRDAMRIEILGTESLGVRGLCCAVTTRKRHIVIDPGLALGYRRNGLLPHPRQVATGVAAARRIVRHLAIIDHHLLRSRAGLRWLEGLRAVTGKSLPCAADYMQVEPRLLEADRLWLYESEPVAPGWHNAYVRPALVPKHRDETTRS